MNESTAEELVELRLVWNLKDELRREGEGSQHFLFSASPPPSFQQLQAAAVAGESQLGALEMQKDAGGGQHSKSPSVLGPELFNGLQASRRQRANLGF